MTKIMRVMISSVFRRSLSSHPRAQARYGFVGLGTMGFPMAQRVLSSHGALTVWDIRSDAPNVLAAITAGANLASSLTELAQECDIICLCVPGCEEVNEILFRHDGIAASVSKDALIVDCSTTRPETSQSAAQKLGCSFVDAPITGERARAENGTLTCMTGGSADDVIRATALLRCFASNIIHVGNHGHGQLTKALNNCLYNVSVAAMAEVLPLAVAKGIDIEAFCRVASSGTGQSFGFDKFSPLVLERKFGAPEHGYPMGSAFKDMEVVAEAAKSAGVSCDPASIIDAARRTYEAALEDGFDRENKGAMTKVWERKLGVVVQQTERREPASSEAGTSLDGAKAGPSSPASSVPPSVNANASLHVEKYKRGILVTGDTLQVYAQLKGLGGSWNRKLGGWILWPDQREEVIALLRKDPTNAVVDATNADDGGD
jgi:3-hydroxyisobutyrate dehydrogenase-like beta-hydroxyacid dehydrogenase